MGDLLEPIRGGNGSNAAAIDARTRADTSGPPAPWRLGFRLT